MKFFNFSLLVITSTLLLGCGATNIAKEAPADMAVEVPTYTIGANDKLSINVWRNEELTLDVPVRPDGKISMPLVGEITAAGLSPQELSEELRAALVNFIRNPQVTVIVSDAASAEFLNRVRVTGAVETPLSLPYRSGMTVLDLVLEAGGLSDYAIANRAILYRKTEGEVISYSVRLGDILKKGELKTNHYLAPSDILIVPERAL